MSTPAEAGPKIYEVTNRITGEKRSTCSITVYDACKSLGWIIGDCFVNEVEPKLHKPLDQPRGLLVHIPCLVCSFQYAECRLPPDTQCPCKPTSPELKEWLNQATQSHLCNHVGQTLSHIDYEKQEKWLPLSEAIEELAPHP